MKAENREVYVSDDGKVFDTVEACQAYEREEAAKAKRIDGLKVWSVTSGFDTTEGRGYARITYIVTDAGFAEILQYCLDRFGQPLSSWYGDGYYEAWHLYRRENMTAADAILKSKEPHSGIGSTSATVDLVFLSSQDIDHEELPARVFPWPRAKK